MIVNKEYIIEVFNCFELIYDNVPDIIEMPYNNNIFYLNYIDGSNSNIIFFDIKYKNKKFKNMEKINVN